MPPSYNEVTSWKPEVMAQIAFGVVRLQAHLEVEAPKAGNPVLDLMSAQWHGESRTAADTRAEGVTRWIRNTADEYGDLAQVLQTGATNIRNAITALETRTTLADNKGYILDRGSRGYEVDFDPARAPDGAEYDAGEAFEHQSALASLATAADDTVTATRDGINGALGEIGEIAPASVATSRGVVDPNLAESDAKAVLAGTATPEQRGRFLRAMNLTPDQLERLAAGETDGIEPSRLEYALAAVGLKDIDPKSAAATAAFGALERRGKDLSALHIGRHAIRANDAALVKGLGKGLTRGVPLVGVGVTGLDEIMKYMRDEQDGGDTAAAIVGSVGGGALGGAAAGAAIGTFAGPVGTAIGAGIGAAIGSHWGSKAAKWLTGG